MQPDKMFPPDTVIEQVVARYWREYDRYVKLAGRVGDLCRNLVSENTIRAQVVYRAKAPDRLRGKLKKYQSRIPPLPDLENVDGCFGRIGDLAGVRITTYEERDRAQVVELIEEAFGGPDGNVSPACEVKDKHAGDRKNYYRATHCQVVLPQEELVGVYENLKGLSCEIQVCSLLAHVWNEIEHDLRYKPFAGTLSATEDELIQQLGHLTVAGDTTIRLLLEAVEKRRSEQQGPFTDSFDFVARLRERYSALTDFGKHAQQLYEELCEEGLDSPSKVETLLPPKQVAERQTDLESFAKRLRAQGPVPGGELSRTSSDVLLMALLERSADAITKRHPVGRGMGRPSRIVWLARRYSQLCLEIPDETTAAEVPIQP